jgi:hypothetical protein
VLLPLAADVADVYDPDATLDTSNVSPPFTK